MVHILGQQSQTEEPQDQQDERGRTYVTNFFSLGHMVPWGGTLDFRKIPLAEIQTAFKDKRIDLFAIPDLEIMRDLLKDQAMTTGRMPEGSEAEHEAAFCQMVEATVQQTSQCRHVRVVKKPKPVAVSRKTIYLQFYMQQTAVVGSTSMGCIWWEISPKELREKPEATPPVTSS